MEHDAYLIGHKRQKSETAENSNNSSFIVNFTTGNLYLIWFSRSLSSLINTMILIYSVSILSVMLTPLGSMPHLVGVKINSCYQADTVMECSSCSELGHRPLDKMMLCAENFCDSSVLLRYHTKWWSHSTTSFLWKIISIFIVYHITHLNHIVAFLITQISYKLSQRGHIAQLKG